jgi:hypothetical protein
MLYILYQYKANTIVYELLKVTNLYELKTLSSYSFNEFLITKDIFILGLLFIGIPEIYVN